MERFLTNLVQSNKLGYRIGRHALFWAACLLFFGVIYGSFFRARNSGIYFNRIAFTEAVIFLPVHMFLSYSIIYFLFPRYLFTGKYGRLVAGIVVLIFVTAIFSLLIARFIIAPYRNYLGIETWGSGFVYGLMAGLRGSNTVAGFAAAIKLVKYWYFKNRENERLEKEKLKVELEVLKAQLQPHFLFNTLNNLYSLILQKSGEASQIVLKLSGLLRYMLTESTQSKIPLTRELGIVRDYIALEQIRFGDRLDLTLNIHGDFDRRIIAPLILLPFVENAFKHGTHEMVEQPWVSLDLSVHDNRLKFKLINGKAPNLPESTPLSMGIGLQNVRKRLELLYPNKYELQTTEEEENFVIGLQLELEEG